MGAWGPAIFSDDTAADIRGEYRELLEDQVGDDEAKRRIISSFAHLGSDEDHVLWLALAAAQHQVGRLDDEVKRRAIDVIDTGAGLGLWIEAGPTELAKRKAALTSLRRKLTSKQPARKTLRRPWRAVTDLEPGAVLAYHSPSGELALFRVLRVKSHRGGSSPVLERLAWRRRRIPSVWRLRRLRPRTIERDGGRVEPDRYVVSRHRKKDVDWRDVGLRVVVELHPRPADATADVRFYTTWSNVLRSLRRELDNAVELPGG